ncbi:inner membrane protein import complex subunit Tim54-domain-containing protein [Sparassis latifolia]
MSSSGGDSVFPVPKPSQSGVKAALQYTGIPPSWLDKRPSLPSRNWLIFLGVTSSVIGYYIYDRQQSKQIRQQYVDKVKHFAHVPLHSLDYPRKVTVYGSKWPGDEDHDRSMKYFRKYVKPILVAAAVDYEMIGGKRHGDLARRIAEEIRSQRRIALGLDNPPQMPVILPNSSPEDKRRRALEGGIIIVGRPTLKEFMAGLKQGWSNSLDVVDREEQLSKELENDGRFDEPEPEPSADGSDVDGEPIPTASRLPSSIPVSPFTPLQFRGPAPPPPSDQIPSSMNSPPTQIPPQPPILFVPFLNLIGFTQIPRMIWDFFNERHKVRAGAEGAYWLVMNQTRPFTAPPPEDLRQNAFADADPTTSSGQPDLSEITPSDLDFDRGIEAYYKQSLIKSFASDIEKVRAEYYSTLPAKLETARALARGAREPTKEERNYPPPTEVELRAERMKKELRWRGDEQGWDIIKPEKDAEWDERFRNVLKVFVAPSSDADDTIERSTPS